MSYKLSILFLINLLTEIDHYLNKNDYGELKTFREFKKIKGG